MKKIISLILAVLLISALVPSFALADVTPDDVVDLIEEIDNHDKIGSGGVQKLLNTIFGFIEKLFGDSGSIINSIWKVIESVKFPTAA